MKSGTNAIIRIAEEKMRGDLTLREWQSVHV